MCGCKICDCFKKEEEIKNQVLIEGRPKYISFENIEIIKKQAVKNVCKIRKEKNISGTGYLCLIPHPDKLNPLPVLITCNHILGKDDIKPGKEINLLFNDQIEKILKIDDSRKTYTSNEKEFDITIIEIKKEDEININNILEIDDNIFNEEEINFYKNKSIYIIHYPLGSKSSYSNDVIKSIDINKIRIEHGCATEEGSSGAPILNLNNFKVL